MGFWIIISAMTLGVSALLASAMLRSRADIPTDTAEYDIGVYRDQLAEVDRDEARGIVGQDDAERIRTEIKRRILTADATRGSVTSTDATGITRVVTCLALVATAGGAVALYLELGAPGYPDLGLAQRRANAEEIRATRPDQEVAEAQANLPPGPVANEEYAQLMQQLRAAVAERPNDLEGHMLLVRNEINLGNFRAAYLAQGRVIALRADAATADDFNRMAEAMILAAGGYVSPEAEQVLIQGLQRAPESGLAQYYWGLMRAQTGRPDLAFNIWRKLLDKGPQEAPWISPIRTQIEDLARLAGVNYTLPAPAPLPGPDAEDVVAAGEMAPQDRAEMIEDMVDRLNNRLATQGGTAEEWARLIKALGVLGQEERAAAIWKEAQRNFSSSPEALDLIREEARQSGLLE